MPSHIVYKTIIKAVKSGKLKEPFSAKDLIKSCPEINVKTCNTFLYNHVIDNMSYHSELFVRNKDGKFELIRPLKYGIEMFETDHT